jgi:hypothetical protein
MTQTMSDGVEALRTSTIPGDAGYHDARRCGMPISTGSLK